MLLPRYSIRTILYLALAVAVIGVVGRQAVNESAWAIAVLVAVGTMAICALTYASFYAIIAVFARVTGVSGEKFSAPAYYPAPFAESTPTSTAHDSTPPSGTNHDVVEGE